MAADFQLVRRDTLGALAGELAVARGDAVRLELVPPRTVLNVRGPGRENFAAAVAEVFGLAPPLEPNRWAGVRNRAAIWLGPDEWLLVAPDGASRELERDLREALPEETTLSVVDVSHNYTTLRLSGSRARELLAKGCALDLHPLNFRAGDCAQTMLARARVILRAVDDEMEIWARNSFASYMAQWLLDAATEFGLRSEKAGQQSV